MVVNIDTSSFIGFLGLTVVVIELGLLVVVVVVVVVVVEEEEVTVVVVGGSGVVGIVVVVVRDGFEDEVFVVLTVTKELNSDTVC